MRNLGVSSALAGAALLAMATGAQAQQTPAEPYTYTPWYEQKILPPPISATLTFTNDYRFRGISQTSRAPGYQGSLDFEYEIFKDISVFTGIWASNINVGSAFVEIDVYGGFKGKLTEQLSWTLNFVGYLYPGTGNSAAQYFEAIPSISYDFGLLTATAGVAISPDFGGRTGFGVAPYAEITVPIPVDALKPYNFAFIAHIGYQAIEKNAKFGAPDYLEWSLGLSASVFGLNLAVKYVDTDLSRSQCFGGERWCSAGVVFSVSKTF